METTPTGGFTPDKYAVDNLLVNASIQISVGRLLLKTKREHLLVNSVTNFGNIIMFCHIWVHLVFLFIVMEPTDR